MTLRARLSLRAGIRGAPAAQRGAALAAGMSFAKGTVGASVTEGTSCVVVAIGAGSVAPFGLRIPNTSATPILIVPRGVVSGRTRRAGGAGRRARSATFRRSMRTVAASHSSIGDSAGPGAGGPGAREEGGPTNTAASDREAVPSSCRMASGLEEKVDRGGEGAAVTAVLWLSTDSRICTISDAVPRRSSRSRSRHRATRSFSRGSAFRIWSATVGMGPAPIFSRISRDSPVKGRTPVSIWNRTTPSDQMSERWSIERSARACSGLM